MSQGSEHVSYARRSLEGWWFKHWSGSSMHLGVVEEHADGHLVLQFRKDDDLDQLDHIVISPLDKLEGYTFYQTKEEILELKTTQVFLGLDKRRDEMLQPS